MTVVRLMGARPGVKAGRAAINARGRRVAVQRLHNARFRLRLVPGRYTIELLGDGSRVHGRVMLRQKVIARAHRAVVVPFFFAVP